MNLRGFQLSVPNTINDLGNRLHNEIHMVMGMAGEALTEVTKAFHAYDKDNLGEECSDILWYVGGYANLYGIELPSKLGVVHSPGSLAGLHKPIGELLDITKREFAYGAAKYQKREVTLEDRHKLLLQIVQEVYKLCANFGINLEVYMARVYNKLNKVRYKDGFSTEAATNRDLEAEKKVIDNS